MSAAPFVVPVFLPHAGCPHRCVFCDQVAITGRAPESLDIDIETGIREWLDRPRRPGRSVQIAFYGGNFLGLPASRIRELLGIAARFVADGRVHALRFSTRPDTATLDRLGLLDGLPVAVAELGAQSMDDDVLRESRRGHSAADTETAARRLRERGIPLGLQLMVGLPGETRENLRATVRRAVAMKPALARVYPTLVLRNSPLADRYRSGRYRPLSLEAAEERAAILFRAFEAAGIQVVRMGLQPGPELEAALLAGPYHPAFGYRVRCAVFRDRAAEALRSAGPLPDRVGLAVHPRRESELRGPGNRNIEILRRMFHSAELIVLRDPALPEDRVAVRTAPSGSPGTPKPTQRRPPASA